MPKRSKEEIDSLEAEIDRSVRELIDRHVGSYLSSGKATLQTKGYGPGDDSGTDYRIVPAKSRAATIYLGVWGDTVSVGVGHGAFEIWERPGWEENVVGVLTKVPAGDYREEVRKGWVADRNVRMYFGGTKFRASYSTNYRDGTEPPEIGDHEYEAW